MLDVFLENATLFVAIAGLATTIIIAIRTLKYTRKSIEQQKEHNMYAVRPLCSFRSSTLKDSVSLTFRNNGNGPMVVTEHSVISKITGESYTSLRQLLRTEYPEQYTSLIENSSVKFITNTLTTGASYRAGFDMNLLSFTFKENGDINSFRQARLQIMKMMGEIELKVQYEDLYENELNYTFPIDSTRNPFKLNYEREQEKGIDDQITETDKYPPLEKTLSELLEVLKRKSTQLEDLT